MKTKKLLYMGCLMAASMLSLTSCGDFLDEDPKGQLNPVTFLYHRRLTTPQVLIHCTIK